MSDTAPIGKTTQQMINAPMHAVYVWVNKHVGYPTSLAKSLGRHDLRIVTPAWLEFDKNFRGRQFSALVIDHGCHLTTRQWRGCHDLQQQIDRHK